MTRSRTKPMTLLALSAATLSLCAGGVFAAVNDDPVVPVAASKDPAKPATSTPEYNSANRRVMDGPPTVLAFKSVTVDTIIPFIVSATGKVVMPQQDVLTRKVTVVNDKPIPRDQALDLVFLALQQNGIAVVEKEDTITLRDLAEVTKQDVPVVGPETSILSRGDLGTIVEKVYSLRHVTAKKFGETIKGGLPDYAKLTLDEESNQIAVIGSISLQKRLEMLVKSLDRAPAGNVVTETFRLRYADAEAIATNINELYGDSANRSGQGNNRGGQRRNQGQGQQPGGFRFPGQGGNQQADTAASVTELRVTSNAQQNSVTVAADPVILEQIRTLITETLDKELPDDVVSPKIYDLKNSDPVKVRDLLDAMFNRSSTRAAQGGGQQGQPATTTQAAGRLANQFTFQAIPEAGRLAVISKSPDNMAVLDKIIEEIDRPQTVGLPSIVELKHASSEDLAEQLNTLLSQDGTLASIRRSQSGLSTAGASGSSPFAASPTTQTNTTDDTQNPQNISFWWQRARVQADARTASNLVGKMRIVPVWRQNALMVIAPPEYKESIVKLIEDLDRPGRQVLISAIICEVSRDDATALGLRWSSQNITPTNADNSISIGTTSSAQANNNVAGSFFDTSVLNANMNVNAVLQALAQKTDVSILSEPKIFTSDNQEASFFDGQDIPFVSDSTTNTQGNLVQSFDYKAVGINLRIRPRITVRRDVDLRINLQLASIQQGQTLFGGFIVDRRETTTQLIVKDKQTIVVSGILRSEDTDIVRKIPILGDIPILGAIFRSKERTKKNTELLAFITPIVVENPEEADAVNAPYRDRLEERRREAEGKVDKKKETPVGSDVEVPSTPPTTKPAKPDGPGGG